MDRYQKKPTVDHVFRERTCLRCLRSFPSLGPGNRICGECSCHDPKQGVRMERGRSRWKQGTINKF